MTKRGSITVFLALILSVVLVLTTTCIESVRMAAARTQILNSVDVGLFSLFGHYDRTLLERFDLFSLKASGNDGELNLVGVYDIFENYMKPVLDQNSQKLSLQRGGISGYQLLTDQAGEVFYQQIVQYMKDTLSGQGISLLLNKLQNRSSKIQEAEENGIEMEQGDSIEQYEIVMEEAAQSSQELLEQQETSFTGESGEENSGEQIDGQNNERQDSANQLITAEKVKNPIPIIKQLKNRGILGLVVPSEVRISAKEIDRSAVLSNRKQNHGFQMTISNIDYSQTSQLLFQQYLMDKLQHYSTKDKQNNTVHMLDYEIEYLLFGKYSDQDNLSKMASRLLLVREGINLAHILSDNVKRAEVHTLAMGIASSFLVPPAASAIEGALYVCWSFAESVLDIRNLFDDKKVPLVKNSQSWQISLENLASLLSGLDSMRKSTESGLSYEDYLQVFLWAENRQNLIQRAMNIIECDLRLMMNDSSFGLDQCVCGMELTVNVKANKRKVFQVKREYRY